MVFEEIFSKYKYSLIVAIPFAPRVSKLVGQKKIFLGEQEDRTCLMCNELIRICSDF